MSDDPRFDPATTDASDTPEFAKQPRTKELHPICQLKLHEEYSPDDFAYEIMRVPGGWLYRLYGGPVVFVPYKVVYADGSEF